MVDELCGLDVHELADVLRYAQRVRAVRGDKPTPELVSHVVDAVGRLFPTHRAGVPLSLVRAGLPSVPRTLLDKALLEAETRQLLRLEPVKLPAPFVEIGAGIQHEKGLLYFALPR
ncbi:hypothetical protein [Polyangium fumosum]|uniref:Uncharacterized protein n=1 Tax=Polyangium fumosum TaxID=889272 RepID=A0A4U1ILG1_9BACT|nr:hypothetical protein [Polyangium fumosum]TKC94573.1 hypothetical protein E8A74_48290 [Polyangium fumosum]